MGSTNDLHTLTYIPKKGEASEDLTAMFSKFGHNRIHRHKNRLFIYYPNPRDAKNALNNLKTLHGLRYAHERSNKKRQHDGDLDATSSGKDTILVSAAPKSSLDKEEDLGSISDEDVFYERGSQMHMKHSATAEFSDKNTALMPPLMDIKNVKKIYPVILANIPEQYTLNDIFTLMEEVEPAAFSEIDVTDGRKLKFCEVYLRNYENVVYLKKKLNGFILCGKKLLLVEPSQLLSGVKWELSL